MTGTTLTFNIIFMLRLFKTGFLRTLFLMIDMFFEHCVLVFHGLSRLIIIVKTYMVASFHAIGYYKLPNYDVLNEIFIVQIYNKVLEFLK